MGFDVIVLGAGMAGVCSALHLQARGLKVALVDRRDAGEETSHGNAGVIERDSHVPVTFPSRLADIIKYAGNREVAMRYDPLFLPKVAPWLYQLWKRSNSEGIEAFACGVEPLRSRAIEAHKHWAREAGVLDAFRDSGWLHLYPSGDQGLADAQLCLDYADRYGVNFDVLDQAGLAELEPCLTVSEQTRAIFWKDAYSVSSPGRVTKAYADLFVHKGGDFVLGDAMGLLREGDYWQLHSANGILSAPRVVVALGPWSMDLLNMLGYHLPMIVKRGYHRHYETKDGAYLNRPVVDEENGFVITPMEDGIRLTSGIEFADRDSPKSRGQLAAALGLARDMFSLGEAVEPDMWRGARPCFADSLPVVDASVDRNGLYFHFGHGHLGFACGPVTGRLLADLIMETEPAFDPKPYSAKRFGTV